MPGTEVVRKQTVLGGAAGIALLAFALAYRFYPAEGPNPASAPPQEPAPVAAGPQLTINTPVAPEVTLPILTPEATPEAEPAVPAIPPSKEIALLLRRANEALAKEDLIEPKDENALALYRQVLAIDSNN